MFANEMELLPCCHAFESSRTRNLKLHDRVKTVQQAGEIGQIGASADGVSKRFQSDQYATDLSGKQLQKKGPRGGGTSTKKP